MDDAFLTSLRCPIDPDRAATLHRERDSLICDRCAVRFPVKQGIPVLIPDEADYPPECPGRAQLPCQKPTRKKSQPG